MDPLMEKCPIGALSNGTLRVSNEMDGYVYYAFITSEALSKDGGIMKDGKLHAFNDYDPQHNYLKTIKNYWRGGAHQRSFELIKAVIQGQPYHKKDTARVIWKIFTGEIPVPN